MSDKDRPAPDPMEAWIALTRQLGRAQVAFADFIDRAAKGDAFQIPDPAVVNDTFTVAWLDLLRDPWRLAQAQSDLLSRQSELWQMALRRLAGEPVEPVAAPRKGDKRFSADDWNDQAAFDIIKQAYLINAEWLQRTLSETPGLTTDERRKVDFYTRLAVDAVAPTNFLFTNPTALAATLETGGRNLLDGLENLVDDLERGHGQLSIRMTDDDAFELGRNVATTPGKVVFQNEMMQLIQYAPSTPTVQRRPLLIVPPWINKFYILDLRAKNSFIKWCVDQGLTVFVISWINPGPELSHKRFDDYMLQGPLAALDAIKLATGEDQVGVVGYCIGGTLMAATLAYMTAKRDKRVVAITYFVALTDFAEVGDIRVFIDERQLELLEQHMAERGFLEGRHMANVFNLMRDNDLIWSFVVNNYLMGKEPMPFDLLYWNSDATRMPAMMHSFYLRQMYLDNKLVEKGGISLDGVKIDLRKIKVPTYMLSTREDHIAPWAATYAATQIYGGPIRFVLAASGHIAGVVNPPAANKYGYWLNPELPALPQQWLDGATQYPGSWWPDWRLWLRPLMGDEVPARVPGEGQLAAIEDAPGSYVKVRLAE
ncbi:class I poly(R)-hydroxyalkanoic acid synthase [Telmatospirillum sp.]|uniref:PHA/PHB synthase family protein n=1 Tax=Telmatospirillum sp. TaxID=2079197 RepID=UPI0028523076|nr:class I poly(R)-hydroxyalkanoic acid synthase [Telmatospirillum sp.]MDR3439530.1 class I poly(R)-hydroxyalkanoic acid synthase [Telmatospirillum sp.]